MESNLHKLWKKVACGCGDTAKVEVTHDKGRTDCVDESAGVCAEIQFSRSRIQHDIDKLSWAKSSGLCKSPKLIVREPDYEHARRLAVGKGIEVDRATTMNLLKTLAYCLREKNAGKQ